MRIAVVMGNPKPNSRTLKVARAVADALATRLDADSERLVVDLADLTSEIHQPESPTMNQLVTDVMTCDLVIAASPTFKATYTGLLKSFFDPFATNALSSVVAVGVMTGAAPVHALAVEVHLRPLLVELGARTPTRGLYVTESQFADLDVVIGPWADEAALRIEPYLG
jgi:FMN reductase